MVRKLLLAALSAAALAGCATDGYYSGYGGYRGGGDYYYGRPSVDYYYDDYGYPGYGYGYGYGGYGYGRGYYGYGYPYYGGYGGYWDYPYYWPPYRPRPPRPDHDDDDGPRTGGNLPPSRADGPQGAGQVPRAIARPRVTEGVDRPAWRPPSGLRPGIGGPRTGGSGREMRVRAPTSSPPLAPRQVAPAPRVGSRPPMSGRSMPRERVSRPPASRERDMGQEHER